MDTFLQWSVIQLLRNVKFMGEWVELETIILNKVTKTKKDEYGMFSVIHGFYLLSFDTCVSLRIFTEASYLVWSQGVGTGLKEE